LELSGTLLYIVKLFGRGNKMSKKKYDFSIVIPCYNEEERILSTLNKVVSFMNAYNPSYEVIIVDDGSKDSTVKLVNNYISTRDNIYLIENPHKGKGFAVRTGVLMSEGKYILMSDADLATPIEELKRLLVWIEGNNYDFVIASREGLGAKRTDEPFIRHLMGRVFNLLIRIIVMINFKDTQCGFKLFKGEEARLVFSKLILFGDSAEIVKYPKVTAFDVEVLVIAKNIGLKVKEVPVAWTYVATKRVSAIRDSLLMLSEIIKIRINDLFGKYSKN
jgi:glycosyltransferase involved in cell wall biosynthesis